MKLRYKRDQHKRLRSDGQRYKGDIQDGLLLQKKRERDCLIECIIDKIVFEDGVEHCQRLQKLKSFCRI